MSRSKQSAPEPVDELDTITDPDELRRLAYKFRDFLISMTRLTERRGRQRDRLYMVAQASAQHLRRYLGPDMVSPGDKQMVADTLHVLEDEVQAFKRPCGNGRLPESDIDKLALRTPEEILQE